MYKVNFQHPIKGDAFYQAELPGDMTFKAIAAMLIEKGFIDKKAGGYQFIIDDRLCNLSAALEDYLPWPLPEVTDIRVHGLLTVLT